MLKKFKLSTKILAVGLAITLCFTLLLIAIYPKYKKNMYDNKYVKTRQLVESAWGVIDSYVKQAEKGTMTAQEAKAEAKRVVANLRYDDNDYFWINDMHPTMIMHPIKPKLDGKDLSDFKDPNGKRLFVAFADVCKKKGAGFVDYYWPKPGNPEPVPKISYVKVHPDWGWIIGSGIYIDDVEAEIAKVTWVVGGIAAAIILGGILLAYFMARSIAKPIDRIIEGLNEGSEQVAAASDQVSSSSQQLAEGASEQAASLEETSSSLEEMASMTRQNADNANQADRLMKEANQVVAQANESMGQLTTSMQDISEASEETQKIIKTIDEIAFQTNLLALNAAVEAARAGEAGAGFAVVADEVRNLAMRAADAAKNTAELIEGTVKKIQDGSGLVEKTNKAFSEVAVSAGKVGELVGEIAAASSEQAQGIDQVNKAVHEMDKVTQQTAANAEESASASEEMNAQAGQMKGYVEDLVVLVGGTSNGKDNGQTKARERLAKARRPSGRRLEALKDTRDAGQAPKGKVDPEEVIPMEDEEEFRDF